MPQGYRKDAGGFSALVGRALTLVLIAAFALPAAAVAAPTVNVTLTFPTSVTVGQTGSASLLISNASTFEDPSFTLCRGEESGPCSGSDGIVLTPSCGQVLGSAGTIACAPGAPDPGVLQIDPAAVGGAGTLCEGRSFLATTIDAQRGTVRIAQTGGQDVILTIGEQCRIDLTFTAARSPALDGADRPGTQTLPLARVAARTYLTEPVAGGGSTALTVAPAPPGTPAVTDVAPDRAANDNLPEIRGTAPAGTTVEIFANAACTGAPVATGAASAFATSGLTAVVPDNSTTTFAATASDPATGLESGCSASSQTYVEDSAPPETAIVSGPSGATDDDAPVFRFSTTDPGATLACSLNHAAFVPCISPLQLPILAKGEYTFEVRATDAARNADPTPATRAFGVGTFVRGSSLPGCTLHATTIFGTAYNDELLGTPASDILVGMSSSDVLRGLGGRDCLYGQEGTDRLEGGPGDDRLFGGASNDRLVDHRGRDSFSGGAGADRIDARDQTRPDRAGRDQITCGAGRDTVLADRHDRVARDCERVTRRSLR